MSHAAVTSGTRNTLAQSGELSQMLNAVLALLAGVATVAAPCTLPVLPILLGASVGQTSRLRPAAIALGFALSFSFVALLLNALTRVLDFDPNILRDAATLLLVIFGLLMIFPAAYERLASQINVASFGPGASALTNAPGIPGGLLLGAGLGLIWTPCAGPVLGSILTLIATSKDVASSSALLVTYALGAAIPMLAIAYGGQAITTRFRSIARFAAPLRQGFGAVVIAVAVATWLHYDTLIVAWLASFYPNGQVGL
jgi:cytochrome c-type biogenesis protein